MPDLTGPGENLEAVSHLARGRADALGQPGIAVAGTVEIGVQAESTQHGVGAGKTVGELTLFTSRSFDVSLVRMVFRPTRNFPFRVVPQ